MVTVDGTDVRVPSTGPSDEADAAPRASRPARPSKKGSSLTGRAFILGLVVVTLFLALAVPVRAWFAQRAEIASLRSGVESARERVAALEDEKQRWEDPSFVAAEARRRLHFVLPGEIGFVALGLESVTGESEQVQESTRPWYDTLWRSTLRADNKPIQQAPAANPQ